MIKDAEKLEKVTADLLEVNAEYKEFSDKCRNMVEGRRRKSPIQQERLVDYMERVDDYVADCMRVGRPLTHAGFALACDISMDTWRRVREGDYDYVTEEFRILHGLPAEAEEYITDDGEVIPLIAYSDVFKKCELMIQEQLESNCYTNKGNPAGSIFGLKARFGWRDEPDAPSSLTQNLVIADAEQAKKALKMLGSL